MTEAKNPPPEPSSSEPGSLRKALELSQRRLDLMAKVSRLVLNRATAEMQARELAPLVCEAFEVDACILRRVEGDELHLLGACGLPEERLKPTMSASAGIANSIITGKQGVMIPDVEEHRITSSLQDKGYYDPKHLIFRAYAGVPMMLDNGQIIGILGIYMRSEPRDFSGIDMEHLQVIANHMAVAMMNDSLYRRLREQNKTLEQEINRRSQAELQALHAAFHDSLTGLPNRALFLEQLRQALTRAQRDDTYGFSVLSVSINRFSVVNKSLGNEAGDQLLIEFAKRLRDSLDPSDMLARTGSDEFACLLNKVATDEEAFARAGTIEQQLHTMYGDGRFQLRASIGLLPQAATYASPEDIMRDVETARYQAKSPENPDIMVFDEKIGREHLRLFNLETDFHRALEHGEFHLNYQPIVNTESLEIEGFEALCRWTHPVLGDVVPTDFIPVAEKSGFINALGRFILREASSTAARWRAIARDSQAPFVSVNLSARQLSDPNLVDAVKQCMRDYSLPKTSLRLELTETLLMTQTSPTSDTLRRLQELGVGISMDDFGTGYSSLSYIHTIPFSTLKMDKFFIWRLGQKSGREMVATIIHLAHGLGKDVVAEGVENPEQLNILRELNCDYLQGFHLWPPMPVDEATALVRERSRRNGTSPG
ncbi:MAG: bifunctional diguanylate cyclase/phosphodiesterase [Sumerlaeia bacterium]